VEATLPVQAADDRAIVAADLRERMEIMKVVRAPKALQKRLRQLREDNWPEAEWAEGETPWLGADEVRYFNAPRSLPSFCLSWYERYADPQAGVADSFLGQRRPRELVPEGVTGNCRDR